MLKNKNQCIKTSTQAGFSDDIQLVIEFTTWTIFTE